MDIPKDLVRLVRDGRVVPFVGAGVSAGVKRGMFPTWAELMESLAGALEEETLRDDAVRARELITARDYLQAAELVYQKLGAYGWNRAMRQRFCVKRPDDGDLRVVRAIWGLSPSLVISTNYDEVMRWGAPLDVQVVANDQAEELALLEETATRAWPWLWHLHGTIHRLKTLILAGSDYKRLYGGGAEGRAADYDAAFFKLHQMLANRPLLYVGFSLNDPYVLQQIADVLKHTKGKSVPSYALLKRDIAKDAAAGLWSNYNIRVIAYEDHGPPLAELLEGIARQAFPAADVAPGVLATPAPRVKWFVEQKERGGEALSDAALPALEIEPPVSQNVPAPAPHVPRPALERELGRTLRDNGRLVILAPLRGGARSLARRLASTGFGRRVTWLCPPDVPGCSSEEYFVALSGDPAVDGPLRLDRWLDERARRSGGDHLIALAHDGGPIEHMKTLGNVLRPLVDRRRGGARGFYFLAGGGAPSAFLRHNSPDSSVFSGAPAIHVPSLTEVEVAEMLTRAGLDPAKAADVRRATGGHCGLLDEVKSGGVLDEASITKHLSQSPAVRVVLRNRLTEDDRAGLDGAKHARSVLERLLDGKAVRRLGEVDDELEYAEVRLYYDGLVDCDGTGETVLRCDAVKLAVAEALRR